MVDGAPRPGTVLTLSHWPATPTPPALARDTSTEIALAYLRHPETWAKGAEAAALDHLDEDGLAALFVLVDPAGAARQGDRLSEVARAGDFEVARSPEGARVAWALRCLADPERSPLPEGLGVAGHAGRDFAAVADRALALLPGLLESPERFADLWGEEEATFLAGQRALERGAVGVEEVTGLDLAVVTAEEGLAPLSLARIGHGTALPLHPAALHGATEASRVLVFQGAHCCYYDRYESWVRYVSRKVPLRRDLQPLACRLDEEEPAGITWTADPPGALVPTLRPRGSASGLPPEHIRSLLCRYLEDASPAWDPYRAPGR